MHIFTQSYKFLATSNNILDASEQESGTSFFSFPEHKLYIVLGCIAALILVAIIQASCTIYKAVGTSSSSHKVCYNFDVKEYVTTCLQIRLTTQ